jgi:hypothetical protein
MAAINVQATYFQQFRVSGRTKAIAGPSKLMDSARRCCARGLTDLYLDWLATDFVASII